MHTFHRGLVASLGLLLLGCPNEVEEPTPRDGSEASADEAAICLQGGPFIADGEIPVAGGGDGDPHRVSHLRWQAYEGCERFVIDLATEDRGPAASPGDVRAEVLRHLGVVRIALRDVQWVDPDATDAELGGDLARAAYSVWAEEGRWTYVDLHVAGEAEAHVALLTDPARVVVDLRPGGGPIPDRAPTHAHVVVLEPRPGAASYPLTITGYARTFEANVVARIERNGEEVAEDFTTATAWADAWGHFSLTFEDGPEGEITLHVGEYSARDGTWEGVAVELEMR